MIKNTNDQNWNQFKKELETKILPHYKHHESTFDVSGIHGRLHISRAVIFSEFMSRFYDEIGADVDFSGIRYAIAFHDSGRQGNGIDLWESDSADMCYNYLASNNINEEYSYYVSRFIEKHGEWSIDKQIVQDSDVLEIMRVICGHGGRNGFLPERLRFLSTNDKFVSKNDIKLYSEVRENLINDAWKFIEYTENNNHLFTFNKNNHLDIMIDILDKNKNDYTVLRKLVE